MVVTTRRRRIAHMSKFWNDEVINDTLADAAAFGSDLGLTPEEFLEGLLNVLGSLRTIITMSKSQR